MARGRRATRRGGSFGQRKQRLTLDDATAARLKADGLIPRWVNDDDGRLDEAYQGDYDFLTADGTEQIGDSGEETEKGRRMRKLVGKHPDGNPKYAYCMVIKEKYYKENQDKKEEGNKMVDTAIKGGKLAEAHGVDPSKGGAKITEMNYNP
jgi:hypothetical protein